MLMSRMEATVLPLPSWHIVPGVFFGLLVGSIWGGASGSYNLLRAAAGKLSSNRNVKRPAEATLTWAQSRWLLQNMLARVYTLTLAYSQLCSLVGGSSRRPAPLALLAALAGSLVLFGVHAITLLWLALDGHGYLRASATLHPRLSMLQALAVLVCHASGLMPVQFQVQTISHGMMLILQQDSKDLFLLQLGSASLLYQLAHVSQPYVHNWGGRGGSQVDATGKDQHSVNATMQSAWFLGIALALIFIYNVVCKTFALPLPLMSDRVASPLGAAPSITSSMAVPHSGGLTALGAEGSHDGSGEREPLSRGTSVGGLHMLWGRRMRISSAAASQVDGGGGGATTCLSTSASMASGSGLPVTPYGTSFSGLRPSTRSYLTKVAISRAFSCVCSTMYGSAVVLDLMAGESARSRAMSAVAAAAATGANVMQLAVMWRRPMTYFRAADRWNRAVWAITLASILVPHAEEWVSVQDPELMAVGVFFLSLHCFVHDESFLLYTAMELVLFAVAAVQTLLWTHRHSSDRLLERLRDITLYAAICASSCLAHVVNHQFSLNIRKPSFSSRQQRLFRFSNSSSMDHRPPRTSYESSVGGDAPAQLPSEQLISQHQHQFPWRGHRRPPKRQASAPTALSDGQLRPPSSTAPSPRHLDGGLIVLSSADEDVGTAEAEVVNPDGPAAAAAVAAAAAEGLEAAVWPSELSVLPQVAEEEGPTVADVDVYAAAAAAAEAIAANGGLESGDGGDGTIGSAPPSGPAPTTSRRSGGSRSVVNLATDSLQTALSAASDMLESALSPRGGDRDAADAKAVGAAPEAPTPEPPSPSALPRATRSRGTSIRVAALRSGLATPGSSLLPLDVSRSSRGPASSASSMDLEAVQEAFLRSPSRSALPPLPQHDSQTMPHRLSRPQSYKELEGVEAQAGAAAEGEGAAASVPRLRTSGMGVLASALDLFEMQRCGSCRRGSGFSGGSQVQLSRSGTERAGRSTLGSPEVAEGGSVCFVPVGAPPLSSHELAAMLAGLASGQGVAPVVPPAAAAAAFPLGASHDDDLSLWSADADASEPPPSYVFIPVPVRQTVGSGVQADSPTPQQQPGQQRERSTTFEQAVAAAAAAAGQTEAAAAPAAAVGAPAAPASAAAQDEQAARQAEDAGADGSSDNSRRRMDAATQAQADREPQAQTVKPESRASRFMPLPSSFLRRLLSVKTKTPPGPQPVADAAGTVVAGEDASPFSPAAASGTRAAAASAPKPASGLSLLSPALSLQPPSAAATTGLSRTDSVDSRTVVPAMGALRALGHQLRRLTSAPASRMSLSGNQTGSDASPDMAAAAGMPAPAGPVQLQLPSFLSFRRSTAYGYVGEGVVPGACGEVAATEDFAPRDLVFGIIYSVQHAADAMHLARALRLHGLTRIWLAAALLYSVTLAAGIYYVAALRRRERWTLSGRYRRIFWSVRLTVLHALRSVLYTVAGMEVPSLLGRVLVTSVAFGLLGLPAEIFLRAMPVKIIVIYCLSCVKDPARLVPLRMMVSLATYFVSSTLAFALAAAAVGRAPLRHHRHAAVHCGIDAAASNAALERKLAERRVEMAARAEAATDPDDPDPVDPSDRDPDTDPEPGQELRRRRRTMASASSDDFRRNAADSENEDERVAEEILMRNLRHRDCCGLNTADFGVPDIADRPATAPDGGPDGCADSGNPRARPNPLLCRWNTLCADGNTLASLIFLALTLLFGAVTRLLERRVDRRAGFEPDPYYLAEHLVLRSVEGGVTAVAHRLSAAEGVSGLPQTAMALSLFMLAVVCVVISQVVALAFSASVDPRIAIYQSSLSELHAAMAAIQLQEASRHSIAATVDKFMSEALDSCSVLLVVVEPQATRNATFDGMTSPHQRWGRSSQRDSAQQGGGGVWGLPHPTAMGLGSLRDHDSTATVYVLHDQLLGPDLPPYKLPLDQLPSITAAMQAGVPLFTNDTTKASQDLINKYCDWRSARDVEGARSLAVVPVSFSGQPQGAMVLHSPLRNVMDSVFLSMLQALAAQLGQVMYLKRALEDVRADEHLLSDLMPSHVAHTLKRRFMSTHEDALTLPTLFPKLPLGASMGHGFGPPGAGGDGTAPLTSLTSAASASLDAALARQGTGLGMAGVGGAAGTLVFDPTMAGADGARAGLAGSGPSSNGPTAGTLAQLSAGARWGAAAFGGSGGSASGGSGIGGGTRVAGLMAAGAAGWGGGATALQPSGGSAAAAAMAALLSEGSLTAAEAAEALVAAGPRSVAGPSVTSFETAVGLVYQQWHSDVTVLFADIVQFTPMSQAMEPQQVMMLLHELFSRYDALLERHNVYKVETIGDCYMAATGLLSDDPDHAAHMLDFACGMLAAAATVNVPLAGHGTVRIRVGMHTGRVMSGVVGAVRARYCLFGDTVNTASRMESTGIPMTIQASETTFLSLPPERQVGWQFRGSIDVKGKGSMNTYLFVPGGAEAPVSLAPLAMP